jgi:predicted enzyme related to lactoylglutathione lyase
MRYEIDENNAVWGYVDGQEEACLFQPHWATGEPFIDRADAEIFAEAWIAHFTDPENNKFLLSRPSAE